VTFVGRDDEAECQQAAAALNKASGFLRSQLSKELDIRKTPSLQFKYDTTSVRGQKLSALIDKAVGEDKSNSGDVDSTSDTESE